MSEGVDWRADEEPKVEKLVAAGPWSRYFARQVDFLLFGFLTWSIFFGLLHHDGPAPLIGDRAVDAFLMVPLALFIEVPVYAALGWTPGKWIFGITVRRADGGRLDFGQVLRRNLLLWPFGFGLGLPLINLYFLIRSFFLVREGRQCRWDEEARFLVRQRPASRFRLGAGIAFTVFLSFALSALSGLYGDPFHFSARSLAGPHPTAWVNPVTDSKVTVFTGWEKVESREGGEVFRFHNASSLILLAREDFPGDLRSYVDRVEPKDGLGVLEGKKLVVDPHGSTAYVLSYHKTEDDNLPVRKPARIDMKVWQSSSGSYWRYVAFTPLDDDRQRLEAHALAENLENSTFPGKP